MEQAEVLKLEQDTIASAPRFRWIAIAALSWLLALFLALRWGAVGDADFQMIAELRVPRALLASAIGMGLAVAGTALQALFSNPLCEPYTLGISSGSALGAVLGIALGVQGWFAGMAGTAFLGALIFAAILFWVAQRASGTGLLLSGVMLGFVGSSLVALVLALTDSNGLQSALLWLMGDLSRARMQGVGVTATLCLSLCLLIWGKSRELDALLMGEENALAMGVEVSQVRRQIVLWTSLLIGLTVSAGGMIGFVGLVVPHMARRMTGSLHRSLLPIAGLWGAVALTLADTLARTLARPLELPVGVVTALVGAPVFMGLLWAKAGERS